MSAVFVKIKDRQLGPISTDELQKMVDKGEFHENDFIFDEDEQEWITAKSSSAVNRLFHGTKTDSPKEKTIFAIGGGKGGVGKTSLSASLGIGLASLDYNVVMVDADLGGANLHTCMGILEPKYTFYHFYTLQRETLEDIMLETSVDNLKLISGACGTLGLANPRYSQKIKLINHLKRLNADYILLDLGAGSSYNVIDFFIAADQGILVTTPEPMAIQETFNFLKIVLMRKLVREFKNEPKVLEIIERNQFAKPGRMNGTMAEMLKEIHEINPIVAEQIAEFLKNYHPKLILNMVHTHSEIKEGNTFRTAAQELLSIDVDFIGYVAHDDHVRKAQKELKPFILKNPKSKASKSLSKLITNGILNHKGIESFREKRRVSFNLKEEGKFYPNVALESSETICSVNCFYWDDCEYQDGGHPCSVRHLDPMFKK